MKPDIYTKAVLTVIACNQHTHPTATARAQGPFAGVQFASPEGAFSFFEPRTGDIWVYRLNMNGNFDGAYVPPRIKVSAPGQPTSLPERPLPPSQKRSFVKLRVSDIQSVQSVNRRKMTLSDTGSWLLSCKGGM